LATANDPRLSGATTNGRGTSSTIGEPTVRAVSSSRRSRLVHWALASTDCAALLIAFGVAELLFTASRPPPHGDPIRPGTEILLFVGTLPGWLLAGKLFGLYDRDQQRTDHSTTDDLGSIVNLVTTGTWLFLASAWLFRLASPTIPKLLTFWALAIVALAVGRTAARAVCRRRAAYVQRAVVVGAGDLGARIARKFRQHPEYGIALVGFVDSTNGRPPPMVSEPVIGPVERLREIVERFHVDRVVFACPHEDHDAVVDAIRSLADLRIHVDLVPALLEVVNQNVEIHSVEGLPVIGLPPTALTRMQRRLKRAMDVLLSFVGLVALAPAFALIASLIKLETRGPVFFRQVRMGADETVFHILKFRTMTEDADLRKTEVAHLNKHAVPGGDPRMFKIPADPRVTRVGRALRRYSLDELPQLLNVLRGEMTLVGPRPLILDEDRYVAGWARKRLALKPGMTGLWQVLGRYEIPFGEMIQLDYAYVTSWSLWHDCRLLLRTLPLVFKGARESY
jgi:exopolysaccharide biosynthesis polyprenyl glycosylphosphotransferase